MHTPGCRCAPSTLHFPKTCQLHATPAENRGLPCTHGQHSRQRGEGRDAIRNGATQGVGHAQVAAPRGHTIGENMHAPGYSRAPFTLSSSSSRQGRCPLPMASTHYSEVSVEMPSGILPLRELAPRSKSLHRRGGGVRASTHQGQRQAPSTLHTTTDSPSNTGKGIHGHHSLQQGQSGNAVRDGATQGVGVQVHESAPRTHLPHQ